MAFGSTSNITLPKPILSFKFWDLTIVVPTITVHITLASNYTTHVTVPSILISSSYTSDNLYTADNKLKNPNISFEVLNPNVFSLSGVLPKPAITSLNSSDILGVVDYRLPLINISFNTTFVSTTTKQTWVFNTITTAHSRYTNFDFNSFFKLGSKNYGINSNGGVYELVGHKDFVGEAGEVNIDTEIILPASTFDEQTLKSCSDAIVYGRGDGDMEVQVVLDEQQARTGYTVTFDNREGMHRKRVKIPKGLKGSVWQFKLKNVDGSWFDINMFEIFVKIMQRLK